MDSDKRSTDMFRVAAGPRGAGPRLGTLLFPGRTTIQTPNFIGITSRGVVPHITPDVFTTNDSIPGAYIGLEDFLEKAAKTTPPVLKHKPANPSSSPLRDFVALPERTPLILGPRRVPPLECPQTNNALSMSIATSVGFGKLGVADYPSYATKLKPDIVVALADVPFGATAISRKRSETMTDRSSRWITEQISDFAATAQDRLSADVAVPAVYVPLLPLPVETQAWYIDELMKLRPHIGGLALYDASILEELPEELRDLPRLAFTTPATPHKLLWEIEQGTDLFSLPFIGSTTDAGVALDFQFADIKKTDSDSVLPLGVDMWSTAHAVNLSPLSPGCTCYACTNHHRAFVHHLLMAKEMLGWVLLQLHNHHIMSGFFAGVRKSIERGTFAADKAAFERCYDSELPAGTGRGPRVRGYQYRSEGPGEVKRNPIAYRTLNEKAQKAAETLDADLTKDITIDPASTGLAEKTDSI